MSAPFNSKRPLPDHTPELLQGWCDLWGVGTLTREISVELSSRMTRSLGRCYPDRKLIRIARFVLEESEELFQEVLCHEAAHLAAYHLHGRAIRPHGHEWKALVQQAGYAPAVRFQEARLSRIPPRNHRRKPNLLEFILAELQAIVSQRTKSPAFNRRQR